MSEYAGIFKAALTISSDNGGINCIRSEKQMRREFKKWLASQPSEILPPVDAWLSGLSDADLETVCAGDQDEASAIMANAPPFAERLLQDYFDEVC